METGKCPMQRYRLSRKIVYRGKFPAKRNGGPNAPGDSSGRAGPYQRQGKQLKKSQILERGSLEEAIYKFVVSKVLAEVVTPFNEEIQLELRLCPPGSQNEPRGQKADEELEETEILDVDVMEEVWSDMVRWVTSTMLSALEVNDERNDSTQKFNSMLNVLLEYKGEELKARDILTSPMWDLFANFRRRMQMILRYFEMNHPVVDLQLHL